MREVAIIGAGELGGSVAHLLARHDVAGDVRLVDDAGRVAAGKALDISQAAPVENFATQLSGSTDISSVAGASVIVVADRFKGGEWTGEEALALLTQLKRFSRTALIVWAGAGGRETIERGVRELHLKREQLIGSAPEALVAAARAIVAIETNGSPADVALTVLGVPPGQVVIPWSEATIGGFAADRVLDEPSRRRVVGRVEALWAPGAYALAAAAVKVVQALAGRSRRVVSCFVGPDDAGGTRVRAAALPVRLGPGGIEHVVLPSLSVHERVALDNAMLL